MSRGRSPRWRRNQRLKCVCLGYWFPHRIAGGACDHSKTREIHIAKRGGDPKEVAEAILACAIATGGARSTSKVCPF